MQVLIVGAGPVGLTLALALHRRGIAFRQIDRAPGPSVQSKALAIQARTLESLAPFGLADPIMAAALRPLGVVLHLGDATRPVTLSHRVHPDFPSVVILPQAETERVLAAALADLGAPAPERGVELVNLDPESGGVELRHPGGRVEVATFDQVLGCDGAHSAVRKAAGIAFEGSRYEEQFVLADGRGVGLEPERLHLIPGKGGGRFFFPLPGGAWRAVAILPPGVPTPPDGDLAIFQRPGIAFSDATWWSAFRVSHRLAAQYRMGRACILGDAAHIHSPAGGQGMNLGMQDACALAHALPQGDASLAEWAGARRAVAGLVLRRTDLLTRLMVGRDPATRLLRAAALRLMPHLPPAMRRFERALAGLDYPPVRIA